MVVSEVSVARESEIEGAGWEQSDALSAADYLAQVLKERGLDQVQLAEFTGVSRQTVNAIVRGRQPISRAMSAKLGKLFGQPADFWLREQFRRASRSLDDRDIAAGADTLPDPQGARRSKILTDEEILDAIATGAFSVTPFDAANVHAASLDLCLGRIDTQGHPARDESTDGEHHIAPLECIHAWSRETVGLPDNMMARVGPMARRAHLGLFLGHGLQVDPGFEGKLAFSLFNASPNPIALEPGEPILTLEFMELGSSPKLPAEGARETRDFADNAARQFSGSGTLARVRQHLRRHMETVDGGGTHVSRIKGTEIERESDDRVTAQDACIEACLRVIRDEAELEVRRRERSGRWPALEAILADLRLTGDDYALLLSGATLLEHEAGSASVRLPDGRRLALPYPDAGLSVRVRQLTGPMHLDMSAFVVVEYLVTGGDAFALFPDLH